MAAGGGAGLQGAGGAAGEVSLLPTVPLLSLYSTVQNSTIVQYSTAGEVSLLSSGLCTVH